MLGKASDLPDSVINDKTLEEGSKSKKPFGKVEV